MSPWINNRDWLAAPDTPPDQAKPAPPPASHANDLPPDMPCLEYRPLHCPACASDRVPYYSKRGRIRYHICQDCRARFKSLEC